MLAAVTDIFSAATASAQADGSLLIHSAPIRYVASILAFLIVAPGLFFLWRKRVFPQAALAFFIASFMIPTLIVPGFLIESVHVSPSRLTMSTGFWWSPTRKEILLDGLTSVRERREVIKEDRFSRTAIIWKFEFRDGRNVDLELWDMLHNKRTVVAQSVRDRVIQSPSRVSEVGP